MFVIVRAYLRHKLFSYFCVILLKRYLLGDGLVPKLAGEARPRLKFGNGHFLFHIPGVVRLICPIVGLPHGIGLAFVIVTLPRADVAAGLVRLVRQRAVAVAVIFSAADQKETAALLATVGEVVVLCAVEEIEKQK